MMRDRGLVNRWIDLRLWPGRPLAGGGPLWAGLCGLVASGALALDARIAMAAGFALFLAGPIWGAVWQAVAVVDWFAPFSTGEWSPSAPWLTVLPFTEPSSPAGRLAAGLGRTRLWWRERFWPQYRTEAGALFVTLPLSLGVALVVGRPAVLLTVIVWSLATLALLVDRGAGTPPSALQAMVEGGLPWLLGHVALGDPTGPSVAAAVIFGLVYGASLALATGQRRSLSGLSGLSGLIGGQMAAVALLVLQEHFALAVVAVLLLLPQLYLQVHLHRDGRTRAYLRSVQPFVMAIMLLTAIAL
jgi:hypothetical protein